MKSKKNVCQISVLYDKTFYFLTYEKMWKVTEGGIYCTYWYFWSYKTLWNAYLIIEKLKNNEIVFSNIKMNKNLIPNPDNYYYFDDIKNLYDILAFSALFAYKVSEFNQKQIEINGLPFDRYFRPKVSIIFDEMWIFANSSEYKKFHDEVGESLTQYLLQIRKLFVDLYFIIQKPTKMVKEIRDYVEYWIKPKPTYENFILSFLFSNDYTYYKQVLDNEKYLLEFEEKISLNPTNWQYEKIYIPLEKPFFRIRNVKRYFVFYDDLFFNLKEEIKISNFLIDNWFFKNLFLWKINNSPLLLNSSIYEHYKNFDTDKNDFVNIKEPSLFSNFAYYYSKYYLSWTLFWFIKKIFMIIKDNIKHKK